MTTKLSRLAVVFGFAGHLAGCATAPALASRGTVFTSTPGTRAIIAGPVDVRAYSEFGGGEIFLAKTSTGTDNDCDGGPDQPSSISIPSDKVISVEVPLGKTACLRTRIDRGYELLWRAQAGERSRSLIAKAPDHARVGSGKDATTRGTKS
jgi:hypothetical protein